MLFWITLISTVIMIFLAILYRDEYLSIVFGAVILTTTTLIMIVVLCVGYIGVDAYIDSCNVRYEMLKTQYDNHFYDNDNDVGKQELVSKIQDWNEDLAYNKRIQRDLWLGIFYPNIYDQFDYIEIN